MAGASYEVGSAFLQIVPSLDGIVSKIGAAAEEWGQTAGQVFAETFKSVVNSSLKDMEAVKIDADTSEASAKAQALRAEIADLKASINLGVDETDTQEKLAALQVELAALEAEHPEIRIGVDTGEAEAKLGALAVDAGATEIALDGVGSSGATGGLLGLAGAAGSAAGEISPMAVGIVALGAALVPIGGLALGAFAAMPALIAGASTGLGALVLGFSGIPGAISAVHAAQNPDATTAQIKAAARALAGLTPAGKDFVTFVTDQLFPVFDGLKEKVQAAFLPLIQTGLTDLMPFFKDLGPLIVVAAKGIGGTFDELAKFIGSKTGLSEIMQIFKLGNDFMSAMGGNFVTLFEAFTGAGAHAGPIVKALSSGITDMVNAFAKWVKDGGFQNFLTWLSKNGPSIVSDIKDFVTGILKFVVAVTPIGVILDKVVGKFGDFVGWLIQSDPLFLPVAAGIAAIALAVLALSSPIVLITAGLVLLVLGVTELATHWHEVWTNIKNWADDAWQYIDQHLFQPIENFFKKSIPNAFDDFVSFCKGLPKRALDALGDFASTVWGALVIGADWLDTHVWHPIESFFSGLPVKIGHAAEHMWDGIAAAFATVYDDIVGWWNDLHLSIPPIRILGVTVFPGATFGTPNLPLIPIPKYHSGGVVQGTPGVETLARLMPGELVVPAGANLSNIGGANSISPIINLYGVDYDNAPMVQRVVTDALSQWNDEMQNSRRVA